MHRFKGPSGALENLTANAPCQAEIQNFCQTIGSDNNIRCLHVPMQHLVVRAIDGSHSSFANLRHDTAMTENLADHHTLLSPAHTRLRFGRPSTNPSFYVSA